jgi:CRP/FNR family transcriptional regulator
MHVRILESKRLDIHNSDVPLVCLACEARHRGVCGTLNPQQLVKLAKHTSRHAYDADQEVMVEGEDVERYANILSGVVKLSKLTTDGRQQIVGLQFAPDFLGRPFRQRSEVAAEAATAVKVCSFPRSVLDQLIAESPELEHRLYQQSLKELDSARDWMLTLGRKSAAERVASFLYMIALNIDPEKSPGEAGIEFEIPLKRADIADFLGLTIETVSRQITKLRKSGIIGLENNRTVKISNLARLKAATETGS